MVDVPLNQTKINHIYLIYMYKEDLALNNLQWLICHKTKPNNICFIYMYKEDLASNNLQWLICHKPNHIYLIYMYNEDLALNTHRIISFYHSEYLNYCIYCYNYIDNVFADMSFCYMLIYSIIMTQ